MYQWQNFNIFLGEETEKLNEGIFFASCPKCGEKKHIDTIIQTLLVDLNKKNWFCEHCGYSGDLIQGAQIPPNKPNTPWLLNPSFENYTPPENISNVIINSFKKKKISEETLLFFKIKKTKSYFPNLEKSIDCIVYPYYQNSQIANLVYFSGNHRKKEIGGIETCFNFDAIHDEHTYITYDEIETMTFFECGIPNVISIFGGNSFTEIEKTKDSKTKIFDFLITIEKRISTVKKITVAMPNTQIGDFIKDELLRRLGKERCWVVQPPEKNYSWNDVLVDYGKQKFQHLLDTARPIPVKGIFDVDDVEENLDELYYNGLRRGYPTGYLTLDDYYTIVPGQWTVLTGIPGHGKSNFLDAIMVNLAKDHDWRFAIFSPENQPIARHFASIMEKYYERPFDLGKAGRISEEQKEEGKIWLKKHFSVILPDEDDSWSIDGVLQLAKVLVYRKGIKGLVIDPWNELDHSRPNNQTETEYVSSVLTKIRQFARKYDVHVWLVAHPAKLYKDKDGKYPVPTPYDISGSAHYRNKADNAITVWRNVGHEDQGVSDIHIQKIRFKEVGKVGLVSLRFDPVSGVFIDDIDQNKRRQALENGDVVPTEKLRRMF